MDHSKYDKTSFVKLFDYEDIDYLITDIEPNEEWINLLHTNNVEVIY